MRKWLKIGSGIGAGITTIIGLFLALSISFGFQINGTDDRCGGTNEDPCISYINVTNPTIYNVDIYNPDEIKLVFIPTIKEYYLFVKDGRCKGGNSCSAPNKVSLVGWNFIDFTADTKPAPDKAYVFRFPARTTKEFLLWGLKNDPQDKIKFDFITPKGILDPIWEPIDNSYTLLKSCRDILRTRYSYINKSTAVDCSMNKSCLQDWIYYYQDAVKNDYYETVCETIGVNINGKNILYKSEGQSCIHTDNILCCWLDSDIGVNLKGRDEEFKKIIRSGEKGTCVDLNKNLNIISQKMDSKGAKIEI